MTWVRMVGSSEQTVSVRLGERSYEVTLQQGLLATVGTRIRQLTNARKVGIITDRHVARHYLKGVLRSLRAADFHATAIVLPPGEPSKSMPTVERILDHLAKQRFERGSFLVALGGGVVGDLTGFAAAIYQRGIPFVQVPTTLVAQVDSSVGGKTGIDHRLGKNLIGAFHQPRAVLVDPQTLETLPRREWIAGLAEVIKYGVIADQAFFEFLERSMADLAALRSADIIRVIGRSCEIKAQIVSEDERESDRRRILNYGHTIGHALEVLGGYRSLIHGEAVGIGMVQEANLSAHVGLCSSNVPERIRSIVLSAGLSDVMPRRTFRSLWSAMQHDKKAIGGQVIGVWPVQIGSVVIQKIGRETCAEWFRGLHVRRSDQGATHQSKVVRKTRIARR
ncbi:3-dehydroquinate synthase [Nitrospira sp. KM1]|uniref:3-dehydroquinate synthase n=1 Tax=Nitrospira sp. KM1 TaxID=1936990 RepID=UPI0018D64F6B|nr:3-dehydroquinate synthase [Nitrospira sp. KM1]